MTARPGVRGVPTLLVSFDGGVRERTMCHRPDRYRLLESDVDSRARIARGGGYSYAAASFGGGSVTVEMQRFNRILGFDPARRTIEVEAGMTLGELLPVTARAGLWLAVQPGYPTITVGGCIAANVHGKNPFRDGTFRSCVADLTLFHPDHGFRRLSETEGASALELTCGGYGLTGIVVAETLRLEPLGGGRVSVKRHAIGTLSEAARMVQDLAGKSLFAYTWHDATPRPRTFGRGYVYEGTLDPGGLDAGDLAAPYRVVTAAGRARLPFSLWNTASARLFASAYWHLERHRPEVTSSGLFDAIFPFARRSAYFRLFGRPGLVEYQVIVPFHRTESFLAELGRLILSSSPPSVLLSMKAFAGEPGRLRFEADGICLTLNLERSATTLGLLARLDELSIETGALPNIIKDSRLPARVVRACYPEYERFRRELAVFDPPRRFRSDLSERLGL
jgi:decaprenylphospho-beta-D-ribofuranose 2-oxidase